VSRVWPGALLFLSGAAALVYQLLWVKQLSLVVGVDVYAITIAISAFFVGLAIGGAVFGRVADRSTRPLRIYAALEAVTALSSLGATLALAHSASLFAMLEARVGVAAWVLPYILVGLPACAMGGTLPAIVSATASDDVAETGGALYAANTAGAVAGVVAVTFVLIPRFGIVGSALFAAIVNTGAALAALVVQAGLKACTTFPMCDRPTLDTKRSAASAKRSVRPHSNDDRRLALSAYAAAGAIALGYEVVWSQVAIQFMSTRVFAFSVMLATYLIGIALGSALYARLAVRVRDPWTAFGALVGFAGLSAFALAAVAGPGLMSLQSDAEEFVRGSGGAESLAMITRFAVAAGGLVLLPTLFLGAAFPAAVRIAVDHDRPGGDSGALIAWNTAGGVVGSLATGFVLVPAFGLVHTLAILAMAAAAIGIIACSQATRGSWIRNIVYLIAGLVLLIAAMTPADRFARLLSANRGGGQAIYYNENAGGTVAVVENAGARFRRLYIQGVSNSGDSLASLRYMRLQALLPLLIHRGEPRSAMVIGFGTGITAGAIGRYPGLERRVCAELLPAVVGAASLFQGNFNAAGDPALQIRLRDGRRELLRSDEQYDVITLEPPPPSAIGVVNLYSRNFYQLARRRLHPDGILAQWWPLPTQNVEDSRTLVRAFLDVFPHTTLWTTELHEMLLVGSADPIELNVERIARRFALAPVTTALSEVGIRTPDALLATWVTDRTGLERFAANAEAVTDDRPSIEYAAWVRRGEFARVLSEVLALRTTPPLVGADQSVRDAVAAGQQTLAEFYEAGLSAYRGDRAAWAQALNGALRSDPSNAYFRAIAGSLPIEGDR
jgi:spermidine synthase